MKKLDKLDRKILFELDCDSRQSYSQLAKKLRQGRDRVTYRIERLREHNVIQKHTTSVNLARLGFTIFKTYFQLENNKKRNSEILDYVLSHPRTYWIAQCDGSWDFMIAIFAKTPSEFHTIHIEMLSKFNDIILGFNTYTLVDVWKYRKDYLFKKKTDFISVGGKIEYNSIDTIDCNILNVLSDDSRVPVTEIASRVETTPAVVKYRIQKLEESHIITGYPIEIDLGALQMLFFKAQLFLRDYQKTLRKKFLDYCAQSPHVTYCVRQLGDCIVEIELEVQSYEQYNQLIEEIRTDFSKLIRNIQSVLIRKTHFNWVPEDLSNALSAE